MIVVADTGPVNYLVLCGQADLLPQLFGLLLIPPAVHREMIHPHAPLAVRAWANAMPAWAKVQSPKDASRFANLGPGEREAISLALEVKADFVLMDETLGRNVAVQNGVAVKGTLGVLEQAAERGLIDLRAATNLLKTTNIFLAEDIIEAAIERDRLRRQQIRERSGERGR
jgi:predicted nucleic acid-binding protein